MICAWFSPLQHTHSSAERAEQCQSVNLLASWLALIETSLFFLLYCSVISSVMQKKGRCRGLTRLTPGVLRTLHLWRAHCTKLFISCTVVHGRKKLPTTLNTLLQALWRKDLLSGPEASQPLVRWRNTEHDLCWVLHKPAHAEVADFIGRIHAQNDYSLL